METVVEILNDYHANVSALDDPPTYEELQKAVAKVGTDCGLDGL